MRCGSESDSGTGAGEREAVSGVEGDGSTGAGLAGNDEIGTPRISARAAGDELARRFEYKCRCRDLRGDCISILHKESVNVIERRKTSVQTLGKPSRGPCDTVGSTIISTGAERTGMRRVVLRRGAVPGSDGGAAETSLTHAIFARFLSTASSVGVPTTSVGVLAPEGLPLPANRLSTLSKSRPAGPAPAAWSSPSFRALAMPIPPLSNFRTTAIWFGLPSRLDPPIPEDDDHPRLLKCL